MEVTRANFKSKLPHIVEAIQHATFIAIDGEFTGLNSGKALHGFDTPEERYTKVREGAMDFLLIQFGLCTFTYDEEEDRYETKAFNFYIFPRAVGRQFPDIKFFCQSSSIDFLAKIGFDFNKLFRDGIPYLSPTDEHRLREQLEQRHQQQYTQFASPHVDSQESRRSPIAVPAEHKSFIADICVKVANLLNSDEATLELEPCNAFLRKLIYQNVKAKFKSGIHIDTKKKDAREQFIVITKADEEKMREMENEKKTFELSELDEAVGFSKIIRLISKSEKLIVGHNMLLDICHILHQFNSLLPTDYEEFKALTKYVFPKLLDTKLMASTQPLKDLISSTALSDLQRVLGKLPFVKPRIASAAGFPGYTTTAEQLHEAGYDAFITGICFITMADYLGALMKPKKKLQMNSPLLEPFINKLFLMRVQDIPYMNLNGEDLTPSRNHVFHLKFPKDWKTSDLVQLFAPFGSVYIAWVDDTSAFVSLNKKDQATVVMQTLTQSDTYHVQTYSSYASQQQKHSPHQSWPDDSMDATAAVWMSKKRLLLDDPGSEVAAKRKRSRSGSEDMSSQMTNETFEEDDDDVGQKISADATSLDGSGVAAEIPGKNPRKGKKKKNGPSGASSHQPEQIFEEDNVWG